MPKRKHEKNSEYYKRKIRKYQRRMERHRSRDVHASETTDSSRSDKSISRKPDHTEEVSSEGEVMSSEAGDHPPQDTQIDNLFTQDLLPTEIEAIPSTSTEVLLALGDLMPEKPKYGPPMNNDVSRIWSTILKNGLPKEYKQKIMEQQIPENCPLLEAPKLNPEITSSISDVVSNRDKKMEREQNQLGIGLAIMSNALSSLIKDEEVDRLKIISILSDAGRIFTDLHFIQTKSRKILILPSLDRKFVDAVKDINRDEYMWGSNLIEKIKMLKNCQRSAQSIKKPVHTANKNSQGNSSGPPRYQQRTAPRIGHKKKMQSSTPIRKYQSTHYQSGAPKKPKGIRERPPART